MIGASILLVLITLIYLAVWRVHVIVVDRSPSMDDLTKGKEPGDLPTHNIIYFLQCLQ